MDIGTISSRYAKALFSLAKDKGQESRVYDDMKMLADSFSMEPELRGAAGGIEVCELYTRFINLVLAHKRETLLPFIAYIYIHLYRKEKKITRVRFDTAVTVDDAVKSHLQDKLRKETGCTIEFSGHVEPELIGGFRLRIGNYRIDASYATQLRDIRTGLLQNR